MRPDDAKRGRGPTRDDAETLALEALAWTLGDADRAARLLAVTGLTPADLRTRAAAPEVMGAVLGFLAGHEPDLVACADALDVPPARLMAARDVIEGIGA